MNRAAALAALAQASGRSPAASVEDDPAAGMVRVIEPGRPPLELLEGDVFTTPGVWHFDDAPSVPPDAVPTWRGYLVRVDPGGRPEVIRLGERVTLVEAWPRLAEWLSPFELASLIGRYFGRDAGLAVHHTVIESRVDAERLLADPADLPDKVGPPRLSEPRAADGLATLSFFTTFVEPGDYGEPTVGLCYWKARWGPAVGVAWDSLVIGRHLRSRLAP